eukprot:3023862-Pyramimonas_sp.AAC.1
MAEEDPLLLQPEVARSGGRTCKCLRYGRAVSTLESTLPKAGRNLSSLYGLTSSVVHVRKACPKENPHVP